MKGMWETIQQFPEDLVEPINPSNKDIILHDIQSDDDGGLMLKATIHKSDTISVIVSRSYNPIPLDEIGFSSLLNSLIRLEERLQTVLNVYMKVHLKPTMISKSLPIDTRIPNQKTWIITMLHLNQDSLHEYDKEKFHIAWEKGVEVLRIYSKKCLHNKKTSFIR